MTSTAAPPFDMTVRLVDDCAADLEVIVDRVDDVDGADLAKVEPSTLVGLHLAARRARRHAATLERLAEQALVADRHRGAEIETDAGHVLKVRGSTSPKNWRGDDLAADVGAELLYERHRDDDGNWVVTRERTGAEVLELLWDPDDGLQPPTKSIRLGVLRQLGFDPAEYADTTERLTVTYLVGGER